MQGEKAFRAAHPDAQLKSIGRMEVEGSDGGQMDLADYAVPAGDGACVVSFEGGEASLFAWSADAEAVDAIEYSAVEFRGIAFWSDDAGAAAPKPRAPSHIDVDRTAARGEDAFLAAYASRIEDRATGHYKVPASDDEYQDVSTYSVRITDGVCVATFENGALRLLVWSVRSGTAGPIVRWAQRSLEVEYWPEPDERHEIQ